MSTKILTRDFKAAGWERVAEPRLGIWTKGGVTYEPGGWADFRGESDVEVRMELNNGSKKTPAAAKLAILEAFVLAMEGL